MIEILLPLILILVLFGVFLAFYVPFAIKIKPNERIMCAAVWFDDNTHHDNQPINIKHGYVLCGFNHSNVFKQLGILTDEWRDILGKNKTLGFLTTHNKFVDRKEAYLIAKRENQIMYKNDNVKELHTTDMY
jgi:hypothetical protein